jgi:phage-related protein
VKKRKQKKVEEMVKVIVYKNGIKSNGIEISGGSIADLFKSATSSLQLDSEAQRIFRINGQEVKKLEDIDDGEFLFISTGEDFIPVDGAAAKGSSSSNLEDEEEVGKLLKRMNKKK